MDRKLSYESLEPTEIWELYQRGRDQQDSVNLYRKTEEAYWFYEDDQWHGLNTGGRTAPFLNFIKPVVNYKSSAVAMTRVRAYYHPTGPSAELEQEICRMIGDYTQKLWEQNKMDLILWDIVKAACIAGDCCIFFGGGLDCKAQLIDNVSVYLADEQRTEIQEQPYILIAERRPVSEILREAEENGVPAEEREYILSDEETDHVIGYDSTNEVKSDLGKCTSILMMYKKDGFVHIRRSTKGCIYQPDTALEAGGFGRRLYPLAMYVWNPKKGSARGLGEVQGLIPNQKIVNFILARREISVEKTSFPIKVANKNIIENVEALEHVDATIEVEGEAAYDIRNAVGYIAPAQMSPDAAALTKELITNTRELASSGEAALGNINPEQTSGAAITAAVAQASIPLNEPNSRFQQFVEEIYRIWWDTFCAYSVNGLLVETDGAGGSTVQVRIPGELVRDMQVEVSVDVYNAQPYNKVGKEQMLQSYWQAGAITFEEFVEALDEDAVSPKATLQKILEQRKRNPQIQQTGGMTSDLSQMQNGNVAEEAGRRTENMGMQEPAVSGIPAGQ